jgi:acyl-CoA reductase-like NAD-dependent aldehyde dehydrogenase
LQTLTLVAKDAAPALDALALERIATIAVLTAGQRYTAIAVVAVVAEFAATFERTLAESRLRMTALLADRNVAYITLPALKIKVLRSFVP